MEQEKEAKSLLSREDIEMLESFDDGRAGYFYKMLGYLNDFISSGVKEGRFTEEEARADLQIALWYSFACNNLDEYFYYYQAAQFMPASEKNAAGCGTWYYRYSCALTYTGRLKDALRYAEKAAKEEPDYPWSYLQLGKLRSHFGDKEGALAAADKGLELVPGDHEFTVLRREIERGASLEEMLCHWIDPEFDAALQQETDPERPQKLQSISCVRIDPQGQADFAAIFGMELQELAQEGPYRCMYYSKDGQDVQVAFEMNEAGISKLGKKWLQQEKSLLESDEILQRRFKDGSTGGLTAALISLDYWTRLFYRIPGRDEYIQLLMDMDGNVLEEQGELH